ncbi:hypothetical protein ANN_03723 [Periplaneta americana]|uniref:Uncharacterized protein n=1 Tax=Periplaneta americana TaxID=6978 RepID=A0ABQ8U5N3_PERAM|nr:hypothetical protein ANN_03723 [Periplaneta americana]
MAGLCEGGNESSGSLKAIDSLMAADGDCHHLCKLMAPVRHRWSINDVIGGIRNTVMPSDCSPVRFGIRSSAWILWIHGKGQQEGGVKLTRKASEMRLAAPGEEVASLIVLVSGFALAAPGEESDFTNDCVHVIESETIKKFELLNRDCIINAFHNIKRDKSHKCLGVLQLRSPSSKAASDVFAIPP